ncbi:MAG TPA: gamma-glutamyl-gamma-aminobutyrate hydrolase family protein, partial [Fluviicola sp.]|nr:gamma-glutamyl-gamma-aminobutyrate hydrolase family protein [Fluviicola sp.]
GMQALAQWEGSELYNQQQVKHGVAEWINISSKNSRLYTGIADKIEVGLYHSWAIQLKFQSEFIPTAYSDNNVLMSFENPEKLIFAVQYHPESILTPNGIQIIQNFIKIVQDSLLD